MNKLWSLQYEGGFSTYGQICFKELVLLKYIYKLLIAYICAIFVCYSFRFGFILTVF